MFSLIVWFLLAFCSTAPIHVDEEIVVHIYNLNRSISTLCDLQSHERYVLERSCDDFIILTGISMVDTDTETKPGRFNLRSWRFLKNLNASATYYSTADMLFEHIIDFMAVTDTDFADDISISKNVNRLLMSTIYAFTKLDDSAFDCVSEKLKANKTRTHVIPQDRQTVDCIIQLYADMKSENRRIDPNITFSDHALPVIADFCLCCIERMTKIENVELMASYSGDVDTFNGTLALRQSCEQILMHNQHYSILNVFVQQHRLCHRFKSVGIVTFHSGNATRKLSEQLEQLSSKIKVVNKCMAGTQWFS